MIAEMFPFFCSNGEHHSGKPRKSLEKPGFIPGKFSSPILAQMQTIWGEESQAIFSIQYFSLYKTNYLSIQQEGFLHKY
jgi:hypothetical protein